MHKKKNEGLPFHRAFLKVAAVTHFPGILVVPFLCCFQGALISATSLVRLGLSAADIVLAAAGVLASAAGIAVGFAVAKPWFECIVCERRRETPLELEAKIPHLDHVLAYIEWNEEWGDTSTTYFKKRYANMFDGFAVPWYPVLELVNTGLQGIVLGVRASNITSCVIQSVLLFLLSGASLVVSIRLRPAGADFDQHCLIGGKALIQLTCLIVLIESVGMNGLDSAVQWISIINSLLADVQTLVMVLLASLNMARYVKRHGLLAKLEVPRDTSDPRSVMMLELAMSDIHGGSAASLSALNAEREEGAVQGDDNLDPIDLFVVDSDSCNHALPRLVAPATDGAVDMDHESAAEAALAEPAEKLNWDPSSGFEMTEEQLNALPLSQRLIIQRLIRKRKKLIRQIQEGLSGESIMKSSSSRRNATRDFNSADEE